MRAGLVITICWLMLLFGGVATAKTTDRVVHGPEEIAQHIDDLIKGYVETDPLVRLRGSAESAKSDYLQVYNNSAWYSADKLEAFLDSRIIPVENDDIARAHIQIARNTDTADQARDIVLIATKSESWQRQHLANFFLSASTYPQGDMMGALEYARQSMLAIPEKDLDADAYLARYASWQLLSTIYTIEYDVGMLLDANIRKLDFADKVRIAVEPQNVFYNPIVTLTFLQDFENAHRLSEAYLEATKSMSGAEAAFAFHAHARLLAEEGRDAEAVIYYEKALKDTEGTGLAPALKIQMASSLARSGSFERANAIIAQIPPDAPSRNKPFGPVKVVEMETAANRGDYKTAYELLSAYATAESSRMRERISSAARAAKVAVTIDSEVLNANAETEAAQIEAALMEQALAEARARRARMIAIFTAVLALVCASSAVYIRRQWKTERALRIKMEQLSEENADLAIRSKAAAHAKQQFISMVNHEFRTPLNHIIPVVEQFNRHNRLDAKSRRMTGIIDDAAHRLLRMVDEVNILACGTDTLRDMPEEFAIDDLLASLESERETGRILAPDLDLVVEARPGLPTHVAADEKKLTRVLLALIENAQNHGQPDDGQRPVTLRLGFEADPDGVNGAGTLVCEVIDQGGGLSQERIDYLSKPFTQGDMSHTRPKDGLGIGLTLVSILAKVMGAKTHFVGDHMQNGERGLNVTIRTPAWRTDGTGTWEPTPESPLRKQAREAILQAAHALAA